MLLGVGLLVVIASVLVAGGRPSLLAECRFRAVPPLVAALVVQIVIIEIVPGAPHALLAAVHVFTYALGGVFVWANRSVAGMPAMGLGALSNGLVITVNDGVMPADPGAVRRSGLVENASEFLNSAPATHAHLKLLGDVFASPSGLPFSNVFSIGDVLLLVGAAIFLHVHAQSRLARASRVEAELVDDGGDRLLLRLRIPARLGTDVVLVAGSRRVTPLPGPPAVGRAAFALPWQDTRGALAVEGSGGRRLEVPTPRRRRLGAALARS